MPYKDENEQKAAQRKHYEERKEIYAQRLIDKRKRNKEYVQNIKANSKCVKCGFDHPAALQFHHTDPSVKDNTISHGQQHWGLERLQQEIDKCEILCANCHAIEHWGESCN